MTSYNKEWFKKQAIPYKEGTPNQKPVSKNAKVILIANEKVQISWVLRDMYDIYVPAEATAWRVHCPWRTEHTDGGKAKTFRVYSETNTSMCFATHGHFTPVRLWSYQAKLPMADAAKDMLRYYSLGSLKESYAAKMNRLRTPDKQLPIDMSYVLQYLLPTHPKYIQHQHHPDVRALVVGWSEAEFSKDSDIFYAQYTQRKEELWRLLDSLP